MKKRKKPKILFVFGTRPEALKLAPVILAVKQSRQLAGITCLTAQHRQMADQVLELFKIKPDFDLDLMQEGQSLTDLTHRILYRIREIIHEIHPDLVVVQGDTTTAFVVALQSFYEKIPIAHVEAGLRTYQKYNPFPEEMNRVLISRVSDYHFAPTGEARSNLLKEGIPAKNVFVTGNTVVDALTWIKLRLKNYTPPFLSGLKDHKKIILVTAHRRESFGKPLESICRALADVSEAFPDTEIVYPVHLNPEVQKTVRRELGGRKGIRLIPPLSYKEFAALMSKSYLILTDSGGIQEEAPSFGKPVLVMRECSERPDGIALGIAKLVGTSREKIYREAGRLIRDRKAYQSMIKKRNPYGDGKASMRIVKILESILR